MNPTARKKKRSTPNNTVKHKKNKRSGSVHRELVGIAMLIISVYALTCVLFTDGTGSLGEIVRNTLLGLFGPIGAIAIPLIIALLFFFARNLRKNGVMKSKLFCSVATILSLISAIHLIFNGVPTVTNAVDIVSDLWVKAKEGNGSGLVGGLIALGAGTALGRAFATVLLLFIAALSLSFAVGFSAFGIWTAIGNLLCIERAPKEPKPKKEPAEKKKKKDKKHKKNKKGATAPAEELSALLSHAGEHTSYGSANADVLNYDSYDNYDNYDSQSDYDGYDDEEQTYETNDIRRAPVYEDEPEPTDEYDSYENGYNTDTAPESDSDPFADYGDGYSDGYESTSYEKPTKDTPAAFDRVETAEPAETVDEPEYVDDSDDTDDADPFEPTPVIAKTRRFGKLIGKLNTVPAQPEEKPEPTVNTSDISELLPEEENTLKWEKGNKYVYPHPDLLKPIPEKEGVSDEEAQAVAEKILHKLRTMKVNASIRRYVIGPTFTRYELIPGEGVRVDAITSLVKDITLELAAGDLRIEAPIPGTPAIGIEVPNKKVTMVPFRSLVESPAFAKAKSKITVCVGKSVTGDVVLMDIDDMPHALVAGQTKSGKSVAMNCMLLSLMYRVTPDEVKLLLIDPKCVEFNIYKKIPHLVMPVIKEPTQAAAALSWAADEMDRRYKLMEDHNARNREEYLRVTANKPDREVFPQMIVVIDEYADLVIKARELRNSIEDSVSRLGGKARACGIHLLIGTQRPSADVITGIIKSNIPARISFKVAGSTEVSIIGTKGADKLLGRGDLLYLPTGGSLIRAQGAFVDASEITDVINYVIENNGEATFDPDILEQLKEKEAAVMPVKKRSGGGGGGDDDDFPKNRKEDPLLLDAIDIAVSQQKISTSSLQRHLGVGYSRGAKLIDAMEELGIVSPQNGSKARDVLMSMEDFMRWKRDQDLD